MMVRPNYGFSVILAVVKAKACTSLGLNSYKWYSEDRLLHTFAAHCKSIRQPLGTSLLRVIAMNTKLLGKTQSSLLEKMG